MNSVFDAEASGTGTTDAERLEAINSFVRLSYYYGTPDEIKPYLMKMAALFLNYSSSEYARKNVEPIIQSLEAFKSSAQGENIIKSQFFISRLNYIKQSGDGVRKAILEMQKIMEDNNEKEKIIEIGNEVHCKNYDKAIRENKAGDIKDLFKCAHHLLYTEYDAQHMLIYAKVGEEFNIENYKIKVSSIKTAEEATIKIYQYNKTTKQYEVVICRGGNDLKIAPTNRYLNSDEYNPDISSRHSLRNLIVRDCGEQ